MRQSIIALAFLLLFLGRASADYYDGLRAYDSGDYLVAAEEWYIAGSQGDVTAQFRLAQLYEQGLGAPQDFVEAHRWYNIAASLGHAEARKARDELATRFTTDQLAEAQRLAKLTQVHLQEAANAPHVADTGYSHQLHAARKPVFRSTIRYRGSASRSHW